MGCCEFVEENTREKWYRRNTGRGGEEGRMLHK